MVSIFTFTFIFYIDSSTGSSSYCIVILLDSSSSSSRVALMIFLHTRANPLSSSGSSLNVEYAPACSRVHDLKLSTPVRASLNDLKTRKHEHSSCEDC